MTFRQIWIGSKDAGHLLTEIAGWQVGCLNSHEWSEAVDYADTKGWIGRRVHFCTGAPAEGIPAYEVTDAGIALVRELYGDKSAEIATQLREFYRANEVHHRALQRRDAASAKLVELRAT